MGSQAIHPETPEERVIWHVLRATYLFYAVGALYLVAPMMGWLLLALVVLRWQRDSTCNPQLPDGRLPMALWWWVAGMAVMLLALVVGHLDYQLGLGQLIKSGIGWAKGWALLAIFPLVGCLRVRPELVYRASMHVCLHTLLLLPLFIIAWLAGAPPIAYVSPLQVVGGPGPEFFAMSLYEIDPGSGMPRWRLFTPWAPALGFMGNIFFVFALQEKHPGWRLAGIAGSVLMVLVSGSRLGVLALPVVWIGSSCIQRLRNPLMPFVMAGGALLAGLLGSWIKQGAEDFWEAFRAARADSTRVRETLARIALDRWWNEAPLWGHGIVERGPHLVEFMHIGSHHSWYGLLFVKGLVGALALALPLFNSFVQLAWWSAQLPVARVGTAMVLLLLLYSFAENLEVLAYLIWPALVLIGIAHRQIACDSSQSIAAFSNRQGDPADA